MKKIKKYLGFALITIGLLFFLLPFLYYMFKSNIMGAFTVFVNMSDGTAIFLYVAILVFSGIYLIKDLD